MRWFLSALSGADLFRRCPERCISDPFDSGFFKALGSLSRILFGGLWLGTVAAHAQGDATWLLAPGSGNWNDPANWSTSLVPTGTAVFGASGITAITVTSNASIGTLEFNNAAPVPVYSFDLAVAALTITGGGILTNSSSNPTFSIEALSSLVFQGAGTAGNAAITTNNGGVFDISQLTSNGTTAGSIQGAGTYQLGSKTLTVGLNGFTTEVSGTVADGGLGGGTGGALIKVGTGTLTLSGLNTYSGGTSLNGGIVAVNSDSNLGTGPLSFNGGTLEILAAGGGITSNKPITLLANGGTFQTDAGTISTLRGAISGEGSLTSDNGSLRKSGSGTLVLSGLNTYGGITIVQGGILQAGSPTGLSPNAGMTVISVLDLNGFDSTVAFLSGSGTVTNSSATPADLTLGTSIAGAPSTTFFGTLTGPLQLTVSAGVQLSLQGINTYSGGTNIVNGGMVSMLNESNLGTGPLLFDGGTLVLGQPFAAVTFEKPVTLNPGGGTLQVEFLSSATLSGPIGGKGALTEFGVGKLILSGTNTYAGGTHILFGTVEVGGDSNLGTGPLSFTRGTLEALAAGGGIVSTKAITLNPGGGTFLADADTTSSLSGAITGVGSWTKQGPGTLILAGTNTYAGATNVALGTLEAASSSSLSPKSAFTVISVLDLEGFNNSIGSLSGTGIVRNGGSRPANLTVGLDQTNTIFSGMLTDGRSTIELTKAGGGILILSGANLYSGATNVAAGILEAGSFTALSPHSAFNVTSGLELNGFSNAIGSLAGTGTVSNQGAKGVNLTVGANNANTTFSGVLTNGRSGLELTKIGSGTLALTGLNSYSGGTNIDGGRLAATGGHNLGTGPLSFDGGTLQALATGAGITSNQPVTLNGGGGTLLADAGTFSTFGGTITGAGSLTKNGPGNWALTAPNTYLGGTNFNQGVLAVNSDHNLGTGPLNFDGGTLQALATGGGINSNKAITLNDGGGTFLADAGTFSTFSGAITGAGALTKDGPGTSLLTGANTYSGGTVLNAGTLTVLGPHALGFGDVVVNGGTLNTDPEPINVRGNYTQSGAGTLQLQVAGANPGQYDSLNIGGSAALGGTLQLISLGFQPKAGNVLTLVTAGSAISGRFANFVDPFATGQESTIAELLYQRSSVLLVFLNFDLAASVQGLTAFYEISFSNANIQKLNLESRMDDIRSGSNGFSSNMNLNGAKVNLDNDGLDGKSSKGVVEPILQSGPQNRWGVWVTGFGDFVNVDGDGNARGYDFTTGGVSLGIDYRLTDQLAIGVMGDYSHTWTALQPSGHIDVNSGRGRLYATWFHDGIYLNGAIGAGHNTYDSNRSSFGGLASGGTEGSEWSAFIGAGYDFHFGLLTAGPIASLQYTDVQIEGFSENGSLAPANIHSGSAESLRSDAGFRMFYPWQIGKILIEPSLKAAWEHEYKYSALPITAGFAEVPGPSATFFGPSEGHDSAIVSAGVSVQWTPTIATYLDYDGQLGRGNYDSNAVTGGVRISF
jgi:fibronectin-binding autotransporter adhesin